MVAQHNDISAATHRFAIGKLDLCLILSGGLVGVAMTYLMFESIMLALLIGFNCGMGGLAAAIIVLRLAFGRDYLGIEQTRNMTDRNRLKVLGTLVVSVAISVVWIVWSEQEHPLYSITLIGDFSLVSCALLLYGWIHQRMTGDHSGQS